MTNKLKPEIQAELDEIVKVIVNTVKTEEIYLFGSFARGEEGEDSDFDIFVVLSDEEERILRCCQKISVALFPLKKRGIDILGEYSSLFQDESQRKIMANLVHQEGVKLYERIRIA